MSYSNLGKKVAKSSSHSRKKDTKGVDSTVRAVEGITHHGINWHYVPPDTVELENIHHHPVVLSGVRGRKRQRYVEYGHSIRWLAWTLKMSAYW